MQIGAAQAGPDGPSGTSGGHGNCGNLQEVDGTAFASRLGTAGDIEAAVPSPSPLAAPGLPRPGAAFYAGSARVTG
jgi:hypothetical protein